MFAMTMLLVENISPIPEPETYAMLLVGLGWLGFMTHRRKATSVLINLLCTYPVLTLPYKNVILIWDWQSILITWLREEQ